LIRYPHGGIFEIPQLIQSGNWECDFALKELVDRITDMENEVSGGLTPLQMNPDFQRGHVWIEEQQIAYIEALLKGGAKNARTIYLNCPYWMDSPQRYSYKDFVCVDGLQRYTAIKKFVNNELKAFDSYLNEFEDVKRFNRTAFVKLNVNNLRTEKEVLQWYIEINEGGTPHTKEEIDKVKNMLEKL
jgi:hypothetical protein